MIEFVKGWKAAFKWYSMQILGLLALLPLAWESVPLEVKAMIPAEYTAYIITGLAVVGMILRVVKQGTPAEGEAK